MRDQQRTLPTLLCLLALAGLVRALPAQTGSCAEHQTLVYQLSYVQSAELRPFLTRLGYSVADQTAALDCTGKALLVVELPDPKFTGLVAATDLKDETEANPHQRLLILWKDREQLSKLINLLHEHVDVPAKQILIEALVLELDSDHFRDLGVSYSGDKDGAILRFNTEGSGALVLGVSRPSPRTVLEFTGTLSALVDNGKAEVLSRPSVLVLDGRRAKIIVGDKLPYTELARSKEDLRGKVVSSTKYLSIGIELSLRPRASDDNSEVSMQVVTKVESPAGASTINDDGSVVPPEIATREVASHVRIANNTPFIIAGLIRSTFDQRRAGIPFLSKIPGLGNLFRRNTRSRSDREVIVVITPHVIPPEDPLFAYNVAKDSDLLDQQGLQLFRNIYRLRSSDIYDTDFVQESAFLADLERRVRQAAAWFSKEYSGAFDLPPVPVGDRVALAERMRELVELSRDEAPLRPDGTPTPCADYAAAELPIHCLIPNEFISVLDGVIPGEDILVKRMLLGIVKDWGFRELIDEESIRYFRKPYFVSPGASCPAPADPVPRVTSTREGAIVTLGAHRSLLDFRVLPSLDTLGEPCQTLVLCIETETTSADLQLDAPMATVSLENVPNDRYLERLVELNAPPNRSAVLLNNCTSSGDATSLDHLKDVLVLKRFLQLNTELPLTLDEFHVGREITFPVDDNLLERVHVVDLETARLFYETVDYYGAFSRALVSAHATLERALAHSGRKQAASLEPGRSPADWPAPAEETTPASGPRPEVRIVVYRGEASDRPVSAVIASVPERDFLPAPVRIQVERRAAGAAQAPPR